VIRKSTVQKNCQNGANTRENALSRLAVYVYHETSVKRQSIVLSRSFLCCSFSLPEVSQTCSQLIHTHFVVVLASGLETRNRLRKRQEKNEFNFQLGQKNFLTEKLSARVCSNRSSAPKISRNSNLKVFGIAATEQTWPTNCLRIRVDRIGLCAQFPASGTGGTTLTKL